MAFDPEMLQRAIEEAAATGPDMTQAKAGGGDFTPPAAGPVRLRLVSYIELGVHEEEWEGKKRDREKVALQFELSGPKHPPREFEGRKIPDVITITMSMSLSEKAAFFKLFARLNHTGQYKHFAQLLGKPFLGTIFHNEKGEGEKKKTYANLKNADGYTIRPPFVEDFDTGESRPVAVDEPLTALKCFIWNAGAGLKEMWDSLFIDGRHDDKKDDTGKVIQEGKSKNYWQNTIRSAKNFAGSPVAELLFAGGEPDLSAGSAETPARTEENKQASADAKAGADADPLAGI
jgi:hypothetical protein